MRTKFKNYRKNLMYYLQRLFHRSRGPVARRLSSKQEIVSSILTETSRIFFEIFFYSLLSKSFSAL
jgi:hypothetical protein